MKQIKIAGKLSFYTFLAFLFFSLLSFLGFLYSNVETVGFFLFIILAVILTFWKLEYGIFLVLFEMFIGFDGHLFEFKNLSVRLALFVIVMTIWFFKKIIKKERFVFVKTNLFKPFAFLVFFVFLGSWLGLIKGNNQSLIFADTSSWLFLFLIFPLFEVIKDKKNIQRMFQMLSGAIAGVGTLTIFSLILFNTGLEIWGGPFYTWVRKYALGKIVHVQSGFFRVMFSSQLLVLFYFLIILALLSSSDKFIEKRWLIFLSLLSGAVIIIRYTRIFWIAVAVAFLFLCLKLEMSRKRKFIFAFLVIIILLLEALTIFSLCSRGKAGLSLATQRIETIVKPEEEISSQSRLELLSPIILKIKKYPILGSGLGTKVSYFDPQIQKIKTTPHLDWGYLEIWTELGIFGFLVYLWFFSSLCWQGWKVIKKTKGFYRRLTLGLLSGLVGLAVTGLTGPFIFYPLGILYLLLCGVIFDNFSKKQINEFINHHR